MNAWTCSETGREPDPLKVAPALSQATRATQGSGHGFEHVESVALRTVSKGRNLPSGEISGEKAMRATLEWQEPHPKGRNLNDGTI